MGFKDAGRASAESTPGRVRIGIQRPLTKCSLRVIKQLHDRTSAIAWKVNEKACISRYPNQNRSMTFSAMASIR